MKAIAFGFILVLFSVQIQGQTLEYPALVTQFHKSYGENYWVSRAALYEDLCKRVVLIADTANRFGGSKGGYHRSQLAEVAAAGKPATIKDGYLLTDALISIARDLQRGADIKKWISNDEVSPTRSKKDDTTLLAALASISSTDALDSFLVSLEPHTNEYVLLKNELIAQIKAGNAGKVAQVAATINQYRWIAHFNFGKHIIVNIPASTLYYFETDSMKLQMKVVTGKPKTKTPRFSTWCYEVVLYPYWNVPRSIAVKEILPKVKANRRTLDNMNMQVLDSRGREVNAASINWSAYNSSNFPYTFRQCTGCDNSLGVIKFNLTDPFHVYMHDTNYKLAFLRNTWFLSHGCIRLEKPIDLANKILDNRVDTNLINACIKGLEPITLKTDNKIPVFVVYMPVGTAGDSVVYYKDIYKLFTVAHKQ
ncbi:MAG: L,D-transpeptidase family protein [Flavipsychrobacter sp.]|nr:L,D-transpeptidase family protein [Flavipsychrobacter sp.]